MSVLNMLWLQKLDTVLFIEIAAYLMLVFACLWKVNLFTCLLQWRFIKGIWCIMLWISVNKGLICLRVLCVAAQSAPAGHRVNRLVYTNFYFFNIFEAVLQPFVHLWQKLNHMLLISGTAAYLTVVHTALWLSKTNKVKMSEGILLKCSG